MIPLIEAAAPLLRKQHSLITRRQTIRLTNSDDAARHLLRSGAWEAVDRGLYGPTGVAMPWRRQLMAAILIAPPGSLISHRCAAALLGVGGLDEPTPELTIPRLGSLRRDWLIAHESLDLGLADSTCVDHIPTTGPYRLAMDLGGVVSFDRFKHTIRELRYGHDVETSDLLRTYLRHKRRGRRGGGALRSWLDRYYEVTGGVSESGVELVVLDALLDHRLPNPISQFWVEIQGHRYRLDLAWPEPRVCLEVDGSQHVDDPDTIEHDRERERRLLDAGWRVLHVRTSHLATDLPAALAELSLVLDNP